MRPGLFGRNHCAKSKYLEQADHNAGAGPATCRLSMVVQATLGLEMPARLAWSILYLSVPPHNAQDLIVSSSSTRTIDDLSLANMCFLPTSSCFDFRGTSHVSLPSTIFSLLSYILSMANHRYSHALVLSHYQDSGLLSYDQRRQAPARSSHSSRPAETEFQIISEVFSPVNSPPASSNVQDSYFKPIQLRPVENAPPRPPPRAQPSQQSLNRSDSIITQIYAPSRSLSPSPKPQHTRPLKSLDAGPQTRLAGEHGGRRSAHVARNRKEQSGFDSQIKTPQYHTASSNLRAQPSRTVLYALEPSFDTEDESDQDDLERLFRDLGEGQRRGQQPSQTCHSFDTQAREAIHQRAPLENCPKTSYIPPESPQQASQSYDSRRKPWSANGEARPPLQPAALNVPRRPSHERISMRSPMPTAARKLEDTGRTTTSHDSAHERQQSSGASSPHRQRTAPDVRGGNPRNSSSMQSRIDKLTSGPDYFSSRKPSQDKRLEIRTSPNEPSSPHQPASPGARLYLSHDEHANNKPLPDIASDSTRDPRISPRRYRTLGFASPSKHSRTSEGPASPDDTITTRIEPIRNAAPRRKPVNSIDILTKSTKRQMVQGDQWHLEVPQIESSSKNNPFSVEQPQSAPPDSSALTHPAPSNKPSSSTTHPGALPSNSDTTPSTSTNSSFNRPSIQTTPPTSPSLASVISFSSTFSSPPKNKMPVYNTDMALQPPDHDNASIFCTSSPPPLSPPSPGSSIDDATPPPIARVRPLTAGNSRRWASEHKAKRPRAMSSPSLAPPSTSSLWAPRLSLSSISARPTHLLPSVPYSSAIAGPAPIPTTEKVLVPPPRGSGREEEEEEDQKKEIDKRRWKGFLGWRKERRVGR